MSRYRDKAQKLRDQITPHINCAQAVLVPFAEAAGISEEAALRIAGGLWCWGFSDWLIRIHWKPSTGV